MKQTTPNPHLHVAWKERELYRDPLSNCIVTDCPTCQGIGENCPTCNERGNLTQSEWRIVNHD